MKVVIFAGGVGTRLWPLSRKNSPKQFGKMFGDKSTLQQTIERLTGEFSPSDIFIATGKKYEDIVFEQVSNIPRENFIFEPAMRDVGPAIGMVASILERKFPDEPVAILWSDHLVKEAELFRQALKLAGEKITQKQADFIFLTQKPRFANQNMGWIQVGQRLEDIDDVDVYDFVRLVYRPTLDEAETFMRNKKFMWNLGYFVTTPRFLFSLFEEYARSMHESLRHIQEAYDTPEFEKTVDEIYPELEKISFDDAILTKMRGKKVLVFAADLAWSDIGAWESLKEALSDDETQNVTRGNVLTEDCHDTLVFNDTSQLVVGIDLDGYVVINTEDVILVCPKNSVPKIKKFVETLSGTPHEHLT
jgi:mannose-1-phosphate guanylyltransferase